MTVDEFKEQLTAFEIFLDLLDQYDVALLKCVRSEDNDDEMYQFLTRVELDTYIKQFFKENKE